MIKKYRGVTKWASIRLNTVGGDIWGLQVDFVGDGKDMETTAFMRVFGVRFPRLRSFGKYIWASEGLQYTECLLTCLGLRV